MKEIKNVDIMSLAKIQSLCMGILGVIMGLIYGSFFSVISFMGSGSGLITMFGGAAIIILPILFGVLYLIIGFIAALIGGAVYNWIASKVGGIKIELK